MDARAKTERLTELDSLRGLAAVAVLLNHNLLSAGLLQTSLVSALWATPLMAVVAGRPAVMFFFVLSGFVLARALARIPGPITARIWIAWAMQRSIRLMCPGAAALLISAGLYQVFYRGTWPGEIWWHQSLLWREPPSLRSVLEQALLLRTIWSFDLDSVLWSLVHEWRISMILPAIAAVAGLRGPRSAALLVLIGGAIAGWTAGRWGADTNLPAGVVASLRSTCYFVLPFTIGIALERLKVGERRVDGLYLAAGYAAVLGLARMGSDLSDYAASAVLIWAAMHPGPLRTALRWPVCRWLGRISFSLYLSHELVLLPLYHQLHDRLGGPALFVLGCALGLVVAHLFFVSIERPIHLLARAVWERYGQAGRAAPVALAHS